MRRYFLTGCTGWLGRFIVDELLSREDTGSVTLLSRSKTGMQLDGRVHYAAGDITTCKFPPVCFTDIIHGANSAYHDPFTMDHYHAAVEGTRRVLEWAEQRDIRSILLLSSGAAKTADGVYGQAKRAAELLLHAMAPKAKIARIFALVGDGVPEHYAIGKFIGQAIRERKVTLIGGHNVVRSYLHVEDCARWLLTILDSGKPSRPYDVGGDVPCSIASIANIVGAIFGVPVSASGTSAASTYLPETKNCIALGCKPTINLSTALERIRDSHSNAGSNLRHPDLQQAGAP